MKCPLKFNKENDVVDGHIIVQDICEETECAWWMIPLSTTKAGRCAIRELAEKTFHMTEEKTLRADLKKWCENCKYNPHST